uniref:Uncharacterized protein n=1 Tax=Caenorhabditis japonica TaxID=281687 RepID=A0A8R1IUK1_CAEJA
MTYGCETWTSKEADTKRLQRAVSNMFEIAGCDPPDMDKQVLRRKLKWAGHVSRMKYDRWAKIVSEWDPRGSARPRGRPPKRWADDITDSIKIFIHNEALRGNLGHGRRKIGILEARRAWSTAGRDRVTWRSLETTKNNETTMEGFGKEHEAMETIEREEVVQSGGSVGDKLSTTIGWAEWTELEMQAVSLKERRKRVRGFAKFVDKSASVEKELVEKLKMMTKLSETWGPNRRFFLPC